MLFNVANSPSFLLNLIRNEIKVLFCVFHYLSCEKIDNPLICLCTVKMICVYCSYDTSMVLVILKMVSVYQIGANWYVVFFQLIGDSSLP